MVRQTAYHDIASGAKLHWNKLSGNEKEKNNSYNAPRFIFENIHLLFTKRKCFGYVIVVSLAKHDLYHNIMR